MKPKQQPPTAAEHAQLRAFLAGKGLSAAVLDQLVGAAPAARSRRDLAAALTDWFRSRPHS
jgi:hypothetical protein